MTYKVSELTRHGAFDHLPTQLTSPCTPSEMPFLPSSWAACVSIAIHVFLRHRHLEISAGVCIWSTRIAVSLRLCSFSCLSSPFLLGCWSDWPSATSSSDPEGMGCVKFYHLPQRHRIHPVINAVCHATQGTSLNSKVPPEPRSCSNFVQLLTKIGRPNDLFKKVFEIIWSQHFYLPFPLFRLSHVPLLVLVQTHDLF